MKISKILDRKIKNQSHMKNQLKQVQKKNLKNKKNLKLKID